MAEENQVQQVAIKDPKKVEAENKVEVENKMAEENKVTTKDLKKVKAGKRLA